MNIDPVIKNDIIARWLNHQSISMKLLDGGWRNGMMFGFTEQQNEHR